MLPSLKSYLLLFLLFMLEFQNYLLMLSIACPPNTPVKEPLGGQWTRTPFVMWDFSNRGAMHVQEILCPTRHPCLKFARRQSTVGAEHVSKIQHCACVGSEKQVWFTWKLVWLIHFSGWSADQRKSRRVAESPSSSRFLQEDGRRLSKPLAGYLMIVLNSENGYLPFLNCRCCQGWFHIHSATP